MRIVFIDLHCTNFLVRPYSQIKGNSKLVTSKHRYILDYAIENDIEILNYISGQDSCINGVVGGIVRKLKIKKYCIEEANYVYKNSFDKALPIKSITDKNEIMSNDIVVAYLYNPTQLCIVKELCGIKVVMGNHFVAINEPVNLTDIGIKAFINEINLEGNEFIRKFIISGDMKYITAPYIFSNRFNNMHSVRKNKAMAIGTLSTCVGNPGYKLYREYAGTEWIQPLRKMIYDQPNYMPDQLDSYIGYIYEGRKEIDSSDSLIRKACKHIYNRRIGWSQTSYFSFDMVEKFNEYEMFLCPEEYIGMPGIGFVEGMACGTAYIGLDTQYYRDLGLVPGDNYISYDGTMDNLKEVITYYQNHSIELKRIAQNGEKYVRTHFNKNAVAEYLFKQLNQLQESYVNSL